MKQEKLSPFSTPFGHEAIGRGSDSVVVPLVDAPDVVVKWNHDFDRGGTGFEDIMRLAKYLQRKHRMLQAYLGDYVPETSFLVGNKLDGNKVKSKTYTVQTKVPNIRICDLPADLQAHPVLASNVRLLTAKLANLNAVIAQANTIFPSAHLDAKIDVSGLPDESIRPIDDDNPISETLAKSPNLLVDPKTLQLSCIDFDTGQWDCDNEHAFLWVMRQLDDPDVQNFAEVAQERL